MGSRWGWRGGRSRQLALVVLRPASLMVVLDGTIVVVALPSIQSDLGFATPDPAWVVNAYLVPFGGLLLFSGRLGELVGRRRVFPIGLCAFTVAASRTTQLVDASQGQKEAAAAGFQLAYPGSTAFVVLAVLTALVLVPKRLDTPDRQPRLELGHWTSP